MFGDTARRGLVTQLAVAQRLIELGFEVMEPVGNHLRYDLAYYIPASLGEKAQLVRIQCKSAWLSKDKTCLFFNAFNLGGERKGKISTVKEEDGHRTMKSNADGGTRTHGTLLRRQVLYPLSYVSIETV